jgi:phosphoribosyl 1,2-cyclic phosphodiesterase
MGLSRRFSFGYFAAPMSLYITSLNSGSNGNCYYVGNEREAILVDAGISCRETERRLARLGLSMQKVKAVFISHEHSDHIRGLSVLSKKYDIPVYITTGTLRSGYVNLDPACIKPFRAGDTVEIGGLTITPFIKHHDAADPHSFIVSCDGIRVGVFTDLGISCNQLIYYFNQCHAAFLEANYDEQMLDTGNYPIYLKNRIRGGKGHLSNRQALELFKKHRSPHLSHLLLAHLSQNNNDPQLVSDLFNEHALGVKMVVASRHKETEVYHITGRSKTAEEFAGKFIGVQATQISLF